MIIFRLKEIIKKRIEKSKLREMDTVWRLHGGDCFGILPPSYYRTHTQEEAREEVKRQIAKLRARLDEYAQEEAQKETNKL